MTLEEKFSQMRLYRPKDSEAKTVPFDLKLIEQNLHRIGAIYNTASMPIENVKAIQDWLRDNTRLGIPVAIHGESLHGSMNANATTFPQAIGLGATFNPDLMTKIVTQIGKEVRANGITLT